MKTMNKIMSTATLLGMGLWIPIQTAQALPSVESRTGEPVVRNVNTANVNTSNVNTSVEEHRAARLTLSQVEALQKEVNDLRGMIEVQDHEIKQLRKSQQDLFTDLERRLNEFQGKAKSSTPAMQISSPKASVTPPSVESSSESLYDPSGSKPSTSNSTTIKIVPKEKENQNEHNNEKGAISKLDENESFQKGYNFVRSKRYPEAIQAFQEHLLRFPKGEQSVNARYWLGEVFMVQWQNDKQKMNLLEKSKQEFLTLKSDYPNHTKTSDAILKLGLIELELENLGGAKQYLMEVKTQYPGTAAARIADTKLKLIKNSQ